MHDDVGHKMNRFIQLVTATSVICTGPPHLQVETTCTWSHKLRSTACHLTIDNVLARISSGEAVAFLIALRIPSHESVCKLTVARENHERTLASSL